MCVWAKKSLFCVLLLSAYFVRAQSPSLDEIVQRMLTAQADAKAHLGAYQATRKYQVFKGSEQKSEITAEVNYVPPRQKSFNITQSSGGTAEGVVKRALEHEVQVAKTPREYEISPANYDFAYLGEEPCADSRCFVLTVTPKRDCKELIKGNVWVDENTYLIRRVQGELAKSPSWWVKKATVQVEYGNINGMWLQTSSMADAKLRMIGDYRLISRSLDARAESAVASARTPNRNSFRRRVAASTVLGESAFFAPTAHK